MEIFFFFWWGLFRQSAWNQQDLVFFFSRRHAADSRPGLHNARDGLDQAEGDGQEQDQRRAPEIIPLDLLAVVVPEQRQALGLRVVEGLLQHDQPVLPEVEVVDLPRRRFQRAVAARARVQPQLLLFLAEPGAGFGDVGREEEAEGAGRFVDEVGGEYGAAVRGCVSGEGGLGGLGLFLGKDGYERNTFWMFCGARGTRFGGKGSVWCHRWSGLDDRLDCWSR